MSSYRRAGAPRQFFMADFKPIIRKIGRVVEAHDGIVLIEGLPTVMVEEAFVCENGVRGMCIGFDETTVKGILFEGWDTVKRGMEVRPEGELLTIPVGEEFLGRVVNPLGCAIDGKKEVRSRASEPLRMQSIEAPALSVVMRDVVEETVVTGIKAIDALIPVGRGQRELILGDPKIGKTSLALDAIIAQKESKASGSPLKCIFVFCGGKRVQLTQVIEVLRSGEALDYTIIVAATSSEPASLQYIAPYAGMAMAEYFREKGENVLIVFDDLTKHAWAWRELSAMLERIPGREGYPGDVFYLHSRLLERAGRKKGGGSITALPIAQTQAGEISGYIPTNIISITDGQIYLESDIFNKGIRPAINVGLSVSRVGGRAQHPVLHALTKGLRLSIAQYEELQRVGGFEIEISEDRQKEIARLKTLYEIFMQPERAPMELELQCLVLFAAHEGYLAEWAEKGKLREAEENLSEFVRANFPELKKHVWEASDVTPALKEEFTKILKSMFHSSKP
ncbi:MAG: F0F1 ATP synthase subunit alpha [Candidatus Sungbacteria bacterium RIFCSPHIGHO2_01_FULL_47_32]|uniref:ATP synthase subunit alpha n=1 Tax=Candidatus Sungbacteria bacterium RIFCSPHIGHO2_01_FULL_47_32 TaxID=1802264 RepID=A0A1G2K4V4_9BACT|nr:MAG: F0F1 ATP synthase subunit alpha [Candidatus Sungbacteria bacterium RIFCSPHIGHO2_01_FULL_47_32]